MHRSEAASSQVEINTRIWRLISVRLQNPRMNLPVVNTCWHHVILLDPVGYLIIYIAQLSLYARLAQHLPVFPAFEFFYVDKLGVLRNTLFSPRQWVIQDHSSSHHHRHQRIWVLRSSFGTFLPSSSRQMRSGLAPTVTSLEVWCMMIQDHESLCRKKSESRP